MNDMKKNNILFVILCTALLGSCEKGTTPNGEPIKGVSIVPKGIVTRASLPSQAAAMGNEISSRDFILGEGEGAFRVHEKVYQVNGPDTRGTEATGPTGSMKATPRF